MGQLLETDIFKENFPSEVRFGDVRTLDGRPLKISRLIQRLWNWPGKAAKKAERLLKDGDVPLQTRNPLQQQLQMIAADASILESLLNGLSLGSSKNSYDAHRKLHGIRLTFSEPFSDSGVVQSIIKTLGSRLGSSADEVRLATTFGDIDNELHLDIDNYSHELGEGEDYE